MIVNVFKTFRSNTFSDVHKRETGLKFDIEERFPDLGMGQTLDMFQQSENTPVCRDWLNREQNGSGNSTENLRRIL